MDFCKPLSNKWDSGKILCTRFAAWTVMDNSFPLQWGADNSERELNHFQILDHICGLTGQGTDTAPHLSSFLFDHCGYWLRSKSVFKVNAAIYTTVFIIISYIIIIYWIRFCYILIKTFQIYFSNRNTILIKPHFNSIAFHYLISRDIFFNQDQNETYRKLCILNMERCFLCLIYSCLRITQGVLLLCNLHQTFKCCFKLCKLFYSSWVVIQIFFFF